MPNKSARRTMIPWEMSLPTPASDVGSVPRGGLENLGAAVRNAMRSSV